MITGSTKLVALIGDPVEHSLSPVVHNAVFRDLRLDYVYVALPVKAEHLKEAIEGARALNIVGVNVTVPHKIEVMKYCDKLDKTAVRVGAVNTIKNDNGILTGYNTDGIGAVKGLKKQIGTLRGKNVLLMGAGGAARSIAFSLVDARTNLTIANRTLEKAKRIASDIKKKTGVVINHTGITKTELKKALEDADILINATTVGMHPKSNQTLVTRDMMHKGLVVNDIVYEPIKTKLLIEAKAADAQIVDGMEMLVHQAAAAAEIWLEQSIPIEVMRVAAKLELEKRW